jgi:hypothetical protein
MKTTDKLLPDGLRFTPFYTGCRLQMALGVKREWKKRNDNGKDYPGDPKTAHIHEFHDVIQNSRQLGDIPLSVCIKTLRRAKQVPSGPGPVR